MSVAEGSGRGFFLSCAVGCVLTKWLADVMFLSLSFCMILDNDEMMCAVRGDDMGTLCVCACLDCTVDSPVITNASIESRAAPALGDVLRCRYFPVFAVCARVLCCSLAAR